LASVNFRYPVFLDLAGKKCLVTGEGPEMLFKVKTLVDASANVLYVNPYAESGIQAMAEAGLLKWEPRDFQPEDLGDCFLVITNREDNTEIFRLAEENRVLCNAVDDPANCRFSFGSVHRQGDLTIAISTNGWSPALAVRIKERLEREVGPEYGALLALLKELRAEITARIPDLAARRNLWYRIVDSDALKLVRENRTEDAAALLRELLDRAVSNTLHSDTSAFDAGR
jgi:siroheme synthase-like protein